ncbi:MAG: TIGR01212 family radical SAM protein [Deltaproteobacteria bacterium]
MVKVLAMAANKRYNDLNTYLRNIFGYRVQKITVDAGLTCPNRDGTISHGGCIYCNIRGSGTGAYAKGLSVARQLSIGKNSLSKRYKAKKFIAYFQSFSNTYAPLQELKRLYDEALNVDDIVGLSIGTRPDCVDGAVLDLLQQYAKHHLIWIEYGLQSARDATLAFINRGHDVQCFRDAVEKTKNRGIKICAHVILGLPYETRQDMMHTAASIARMGIDGVKLHLLYVVKGTPLETLYHKGEFNCLEQPAYVDLVCDFLERIPAEMVIQRLTGDPHREELVAPRWELIKTETLNLIRHTLEKRDSWQGKYVNSKTLSSRRF